MSGGHKRILSHITGRKKAWNKTRKKRQNLAEWLEESLNNKGEFYNGTEVTTGGVL